MPRHVPVLIAVAAIATCAASAARAQTAGRARVSVLEQASLSNGTVQGLVRDEIGQAVGGVSVIAMGTTLGAVKSDGSGRFSIALAPGDYVLRATREGYVSTYREALRIQTSARLERNITLVRQGVAAARSITLAAAGAPTSPRSGRQSGLGDLESAAEADLPHDEAAWRMRHLTRTALRDVAPATGLEDAAVNTRSFARRSSFLGWAAGANLSGQVNFLTTGALSSSSGWLPTQLPRGIAYVAVSAPTGARGDWTIRGATTAGDWSSWVLLGEYRSRAARSHDVTVGMSHSTQFYPGASGATVLAAGEGSRNVGGLYGADRWRVLPGLEVDYGMRLDSYDYLQSSALWSLRFGARVRVMRGIYVSGLVSQRMVAPGADEFLPPPSTGLWLPPERTFAPLQTGAAFVAERVRHYDVGVTREFGEGASPPSIAARRFRQSSHDQSATLFGLDEATDAAHYSVATPGSVDVEGWAVRFTGHLTRRLTGAVDYSVSEARWTAGPDAAAIARILPSAARADRERLHDVTASLEAVVPRVKTRMTAVYRLNTAFSDSPSAEREPVSIRRFDVEIHQALPFQPVRGGTMALLLSVRNLFRDARDAGSMYDELLTVAPPLRIMGGIQMKF